MKKHRTCGFSWPYWWENISQLGLKYIGRNKTYKHIDIQHFHYYIKLCYPSTILHNQRFQLVKSYVSHEKSFVKFKSTVF